MQDTFELNDEEIAAGFSVQTLTYPGDYELAGLEAEGGRQLQRTVALAVDEKNRIKRRQGGDGYVHEIRDADGWSVTAEFETLVDVLASEAYGRWRRAEAEEDEVALEEEEEEQDEE